MIYNEIVLGVQQSDSAVPARPSVLSPGSLAVQVIAECWAELAVRHSRSLWVIHCVDNDQFFLIHFPLVCCYSVVVVSDSGTP